MKKIKLGSYVSFKGPKYFVGAVESAVFNQANCLMMFLGSPQTPKRVDASLWKFDEYQQNLLKIIDKNDIVIHAPYFINPASLEKYQFAVEFLIKEINIMNKLGLNKLVLHPGSATKFSREDSVERLVKSLKEIILQTQNVEILLETMAGKGNEIGTNFEELKKIIDKVNSPRLGICLDTCHVWDSGYNIQDYQNFMNYLENKKYLQYIKVIHLNDSKNGLGSRKDKHENVGKGKIGLETLARFVHDKRWINTWIFLETPEISKTIYKEEIALLLDSKKWLD